MIVAKASNCSITFTKNLLEDDSEPHNQKGQGKGLLPLMVKTHTVRDAPCSVTGHCQDSNKEPNAAMWLHRREKQAASFDVQQLIMPYVYSTQYTLLHRQTEVYRSCLLGPLIAYRSPP